MKKTNQNQYVLNSRRKFFYGLGLVVFLLLSIFLLMSFKNDVFDYFRLKPRAVIVGNQSFEPCTRGNPRQGHSNGVNLNVQDVANHKSYVLQCVDDSSLYPPGKQIIVYTAGVTREGDLIKAYTSRWEGLLNTSGEVVPIALCLLIAIGFGFGLYKNRMI